MLIAHRTPRFSIEHRPLASLFISSRNFQYILLLLSSVMPLTVNAEDIDDAKRFMAAKNYTQAAITYKNAADKGSMEAQLALGTLYEEGKGVAQDDKVAASWYRLAAEKGSKEAAFHLGWQYDTGRGVAQSFASAASWYQKASDGPDAIPQAQYSLGVLYELGRGVKPDLTKATALYAQATFKHFARAEFRLGWLSKTRMERSLR